MDRHLPFESFSSLDDSWPGLSIISLCTFIWPVSSMNAGFRIPCVSFLYVLFPWIFCSSILLFLTCLSMNLLFIFFLLFRLILIHLHLIRFSNEFLVHLFDLFVHASRVQLFLTFYFLESSVHLYFFFLTCLSMNLLFIFFDLHCRLILVHLYLIRFSHEFLVHLFISLVNPLLIPYWSPSSNYLMWLNLCIRSVVDFFHWRFAGCIHLLNHLCAPMSIFIDG